jgi:hypothetical protein
MYALIFDEHNLDEPMKKVISVHDSRKEAEQALESRKKKLGRKVWECNTRVVWIERKINAGNSVQSGQYSTWRSGEKIPEGELYSDTD